MKLPRLERDLENRCVKLARSRGWLSRKMNGLGNASWPDRLFVPPPNIPIKTVLWVEFKLPGKDPTPLQEHMHKDLRARGQWVDVIDNENDFKELIGVFE
jgi:hypothetical protein